MVAYAVYGLLRSNLSGSKILVEDALPKEETISAPAQNNTNSPADSPSLVGKLEDYVLQKETGTATSGPQPQQDLLKEKEELLKQGAEQLNKLRDENTALKKKLADKEKEITEEFSKGVNFNKDLNEARSRLEALQKEIKEKSDQLEAQKHQIEKYIEQEKEQAKAIEGLKGKQEGSGWVSKDEFNNLNAEYAKLKKELEAKEEKLRKLVEELEAVKGQLIDKASFETTPPKPQEPSDTQPKEEPPRP